MIQYTLAGGEVVDFEPEDSVAARRAATDRRPRDESGDVLSVADVRRYGSELRDLRLQKDEIEEILRKINVRINELEWRIIPDAMGRAGTDSVGVPPEGNFPGCDLTVEEKISAKWADMTPEQRRAAVEWLDDGGFGDLIKTEVVAEFAREDREAAREVLAGCRAQGRALYVDARESVNSQTLAAWIRDRARRGLPLPQLDLLGAKRSVRAVLKFRR